MFRKTTFAPCCCRRTDRGRRHPGGGAELADRPVTMVVPFGAGSASDTVGRVLAVGLSEVARATGHHRKYRRRRQHDRHRARREVPARRLPVRVRQRRLHGHRPDHAQAPLYNSATDFAAVGLVVEQPIVLITRKDLPANTMQEFVAYAKANQGKCSSAPPASARGRISPARG